MTDAILRTIYYDSDDGFMSAVNLLKSAKSQDASITMKIVKDWLGKQSSIQTLTKRKLFNSYVASHPMQQIGVDLADYSKSSQHNDGYSYIFVGVDYFSKFVVAFPLTTKTGSDLAHALSKMIIDMKKAGKADIEAIVSDTEGGTNTPLFIKVLNDNKIRHIQSSTPVGMIERVIKTIKDLIHKRILGLKLQNERWIDLLDKVVSLYNEKHIHSTIKMTPRQALDTNNNLQVYMNIKNKAKFKMAWPTLTEGDMVRTAIKSSSMTKAHHPKFSVQVYKISHVSINQDGTSSYLLIGHPNRKLFYRWELRRISNTDDKDTV